MNITQRLLDQDETLKQHNEGLWNVDFDKDMAGFSSFNDAGIEVETGEFLYAMCRVLKPTRVLETGTHWGIGASYMGCALRDNKQGILDTVEFLPEIHNRAQTRIAALGLNDFVICHFGDVAGFEPRGEYDMILLDTEPQTRFAEFKKFYEFLKPGGFLFIHDLHRHMHQIPNEEHGFAWPYGPITDFMRLKVINDEVRPIHFETPRGLTGFYKVSPKDYKWK
jgi:predicted O-methyltransferase YrrM